MSVPENWWKDFFSGLAVEMWRVVPTPEDNRAEADWIETQLQVTRPSRLLDVPCGDGRLSLELAGRGHNLVGVDASREFLEAARASVKSRGLPEGRAGSSVEFMERDMRDLPWRAEFDGAFTFGNSFGYLGDRGDRDFLRAVGRALKPGARLAMDTKCAEMVFPGFRPDIQQYEFGGIKTEMQDRYDPFRARVDTEYIFSRGERRERKWASERIYMFREFCVMLESAGFADVKGYGSMALEPLRLGSSRLFVVATRRQGSV